MSCIDRMYIGSDHHYTKKEVDAYVNAVNHFNKNLSTHEEFEYPDYGGLPRHIANSLSSDHVDNIQHNWDVIKDGNFMFDTR